MVVLKLVQICIKCQFVLFTIHRMVTFCYESWTKYTNPLCGRIQFLNAGRAGAYCDSRKLMIRHGLTF